MSPEPPEDKAAYTIAKWCNEAEVSEPLYYKEQKAGRGPYIARMGRRTIITESPRQFFQRRRREAAAQQPREMEAV